MDTMSNKFGLPQSLLDAVKQVRIQENEYQEKVKALMKKRGFTSIGQMSPEEKKDFFNTLDAMHKAKDEQSFMRNPMSIDEGIFGLSPSEKGKVQAHAHDISDNPGHWDHKNQTFTQKGWDAMHKALGGSKKHMDYAKKTYGPVKEEVDEACWDTHRQDGMKKKGDKMVPNCVPKEESSPPFTPDKPKKNPGVVPGKHGVGPSIAKHLAKMAMKKQMDKDKKKPMKEEEKLDEAIPKSTGHALIHSSSKKIIAKGSKAEMMKKMKELNAKEKGSHYLGATSGKVGDIFGFGPSPADKLSVRKEEELDEGMSSAQVTKLRQEYDKIKTIDPSSDNYKKLTAMLDKLDLKALQSLAGAKIKFVSSLAQNRVIRKMNEEKTVGAKKEATGHEKPVKKGEKVSGKKEPITIDPEVDEKK